MANQSQRSSAKAERKTLHETYWAEHADERKRSESEKAEAEARIAGVGMFKSKKRESQATIGGVNAELNKER